MRLTFALYGLLAGLLTACSPMGARPLPTREPTLCEHNLAAMQTAVVQLATPSANILTDTLRLAGLLATLDACRAVTPESGR